MQRVTAPDYKPTQDDMLRVRRKTTGVKELKFKVNDKLFCFIDVGGQRSERRKWIAQFDGIRAILFFASASDFDQTLEEDSTVSRLSDSIALFRSISNNPFFAASTMILFLNKIDILQTKLESKTFADYIKHYDG